MAFYDTLDGTPNYWCNMRIQSLIVDGDITPSPGSIALSSLESDGSGGFLKDTGAEIVRTPILVADVQTIAAGAPEGSFLRHAGGVVSFATVPLATGMGANEVIVSDGAGVPQSVPSIGSANITDNSILTSKVLDANITPSKLAPGPNNNYLYTNGVGTVVWSPIPSTVALSNITGAGVNEVFVSDGAGVIQSVAGIDSANIVDDAVVTSKILDSNVTIAKINPGGNNTFLNTDAGGLVNWTATVPASSVALNDVTGMGANEVIVSDGAGIPQSVASLDSANITDAAIITSKILDANVTPAKMAAGAINTFLNTDGAGVVNWTATVPASSVDLNDVTGMGANEVIVSDGAGVPQSVASLDSVNITDDAIITSKILDANVTLAKIDTAGTSAGEILTSTGSGSAPAWSLPAVPLVTSAYSSAGGAASNGIEDLTAVYVNQLGLTNTSGSLTVFAAGIYKFEARMDFVGMASADTITASLREATAAFDTSIVIAPTTGGTYNANVFLMGYVTNPTNIDLFLSGTAGTFTIENIKLAVNRIS